MSESFEEMVRSEQQRIKQEGAEARNRNEDRIKQEMEEKRQIQEAFLKGIAILRREDVESRDVAYVEHETRLFKGSVQVRRVYGQGWLLRGCQSDDICGGQVLLAEGRVVAAHTCNMLYGDILLPSDIKVYVRELKLYERYTKEQVATVIAQLLVE